MVQSGTKVGSRERAVVSVEKVQEAVLDVALAVAVVLAAGLHHVLEVLLRHPGGHGLHVGVLGQQVLLAPQAVADLPGQTEDLLHTHIGLAQTLKLMVDAVQ